MKTAGIIGGIGPESTIAYYRALLASYRARNENGGAPSLLINSIDMRRMLRGFDENRADEVTAYLSEEVGKLQRGGADFAALSSVTPHIVFEDLRTRVSLPLLSIVEATRHVAATYGMRRVALFGTRFTMQAPFFPEAFAKAHIQIITPAANEQNYIHDKYFGELVNGVFLDATRSRMLDIVDRLKRDESIDGLILGGTELPLLLDNQSHNGVIVLNTMQLHVDAIVDELLS